MTTQRVRLPDTIRLQRPALWRTDIAQLAVIPLLFTIVVIAEVLGLRAQQPLNWDETVYASQISQHAPMLWGPERARGLPLLLAPVTLLTSSAPAMRAYMAILAGIGLFLAALAWRRIRPTWVIVLGTAMFAGLSLTQNGAASILPHYWSAVGALAVVGLSLRMARFPSTRDAWLLLIAVAFTGLMRPTDVIFLTVPIAIVMAVVLKQRVRPILVAIGGGLVISLGEWLVEANLYFGGPVKRLSRASGASGGTHLNLLNNLHVLDGGRITSLHGYAGSSGAWHYPYLLIWWAFFVALVVLGVRAAYSRDGRLLARLPVICALSIYLLYSIPVRDNGRYLQPVLVLLMIPAAEGAGFLIRRWTGQRYGYAAMGAVAILVLAEFASQAPLIKARFASTGPGLSAQSAVVRHLQSAGVKPPCVITSVPRPGFVQKSEPAAYYLNCSYRWGVRKLRNLHGTLVVLTNGAARPWPYAAKWHKVSIPGQITAYIGPAPKQH
ncbi:MAG: hypothetical protein LBI49_25395 [Nocardiopsaceae bacterium]|nr:hypothetical protein [Nocardiopsaceae bacterium]